MNAVRTLLCLLLGIAIPEAQGQPRSALDSVLHRAVARGVPGVQAVVQHGAFVGTGTAGVASVESARTMSATDRIRTASITKMLTYATVMELVRDGRLQLSDRAVDRLPPGTLQGIPYASEITIEQLLQHTSGLYNYNGNDGDPFFAQLFGAPDRSTKRWTPAALIAFARQPALRPTGRPGAQRSYSSTGYSVLELIIEHVEKKPYAQVVRERIFRPLQMTRSGVEGADLFADSIVDSYARPGERSGPTPFGNRRGTREDGLVNLSAGLRHYNAWAGAGGSVASTATDLGKFMRAVRSGRMIVLKDQAAEFARVGARPNGTLSWNGGSWGISAAIVYEPGRDITVIVLSNASNAGPSSGDIARELLAAQRTKR